MEMSTIKKIREHRTDSVEEDKEIIHKIIEEFKKEEEHFDSCTLLEVMSENCPEAFDEKIQEEVLDISKELEESRPRAMMSSCIHNIVEENPKDETLVPALNQLLKVRKEKKRKNLGQENLAAYNSIKSWEKLDLDVPEDVIKSLEENKQHYTPSTKSALASLYATCIIEKQENKREAFSGLKEIVNNAGGEFLLNKSMLEMSRCVEDGPLEKDILETHYTKYSEEMSEIERKMVKQTIT